MLLQSVACVELPSVGPFAWVTFLDRNVGPGTMFSITEQRPPDRAPLRDQNIVRRCLAHRNRRQNVLLSVFEEICTAKQGVFAPENRLVNLCFQARLIFAFRFLFLRISISKP